MITGRGAVNEEVHAVQQLSVAYMTKWVKEWQDKHPDAVKGGAVTVIDPATLPALPDFVPLVSLSDNPPPVARSEVFGPSQ